jgi:hypothetical protein
VRDGTGAAVAGATVHLSATGAGNSLTQPGGPTGADGVATGTLSSTVPGTKRVTATVNGNIQIDQRPEVAVTVAPATTIALLEGDGQTADQGQPVPTRPAVKVTNDLGQGIAGVGVTFVVTGGNGSVTGAAQTTNSAGVATVGSWVLGDAGTNTLEARAPGLNGNPVVFTATANPTGGGDAADHLVFLVQPASPQRQDENINPAVQVALVDHAGNVVPVSGVRIELSLNGRDRDLRGHERVDTSDGIAVFDDIRVRRSGSGYVLTASAPERPELGEVASSSFDVEN